MSSIDRSSGQPSLDQIIDRKLQRKANGVDLNDRSAARPASPQASANHPVTNSHSDQAEGDLDSEFANLLFGKSDVRLVPKVENHANNFFDSKQKILGTKANFLTLNKQEDCKAQSELEGKPVEFQLLNVMEQPILVSVQKRRGMVKMVLSLPNSSQSSPLDAQRLSALEKCLQNHFTKSLGVEFLVEVKSGC